MYTFSSHLTFSPPLPPRVLIHPCSLSSSRLPPITWQRVPLVLGPHEVDKRLGLLVVVRRVAVVVVVVRVRVVGRADVLHAVDAAALGAAFHGAGAGHLVIFVSKWRWEEMNA